MVFSPWCVLQVNEVATIGYAPSWILGSRLEITKFPTTNFKCFQDYLHLGLQHQSLLVVGLSL